MSSPNRPSFEQLLDWLEGRLSAAEAEKMAARMAQVDDAEIQEDAAWIQAFLQAKQTMVLAAPPSAVRQSLLQSFSAQIKPKAQPAPPAAPPVTERPQNGFFQRLLGVLTFDSHGQLGLAGARGGAQPVARQLIYQGTMADVALNLHLDRQQQHFTILGQCLPTGEAWPVGAAVQLLQAEHEIAITLTDDLGEFSFVNLLPGEYQLIVSAEQCDIVIPPLVLAL